MIYYFKKYYFILLLILLLLGGVGYYFVVNSNKEEVNNDLNEIVKIDDYNEDISIDIKGAVNKPGVYKLSSGSNIHDAIETAGGLKKGATTKNINLSRMLKNEWIIYIYTEKELNNIINKNKESIKPIAPCVCETIEINKCLDSGSSVITPKDENILDGEKTITPETSDEKVSINFGTLEDLMTLSGIGNAKATSIIEYRELNGLFTNLNDLTKVSGISEAMYEKIKNNIKL